MSAPPTDLRRYLVALVSLTLVQVISTMVFNQASVLAPAAAAEFGIAAADVAYYVSIVYLAAMISSVGGGTITRRLGPIRFMQTGLTVRRLGSFVFADRRPGDGRAVGLHRRAWDSGPLTIASSHILAGVSPQRSANVTFSLKQSGVPVGFAICGAVLPTLAIDFGWRWAAAVGRPPLDRSGDRHPALARALRRRAQRRHGACRRWPRYSSRCSSPGAIRSCGRCASSACCSRPPRRSS